MRGKPRLAIIQTPRVARPSNTMIRDTLSDDRSGKSRALLVSVSTVLEAVIGYGHVELRTKLPSEPDLLKPGREKYVGELPAQWGLVNRSSRPELSTTEVAKAGKK